MDHRRDVLWAAQAAVGQRTGKYYTEGQKLAESPDAVEADVLARLRAPDGARLHWATVGLFLLLLLDMIFKPGALTVLATIRPDDINVALLVTCSAQWCSSAGS